MKYFIHLPMKMEPIVSSETSAIRTQTPGNYPKRNKLHVILHYIIHLWRKWHFCSTYYHTLLQDRVSLLLFRPQKSLSTIFFVTGCNKLKKSGGGAPLITQWHNYTMTRWHNDTMTQWHNIRTKFCENRWHLSRKTRWATHTLTSHSDNTVTV